MDNYIDILFTVAPHAEGEFVEVENMHGQSIKAGEWIQREDGFWVLRIRPEVFA